MDICFVGSLPQPYGGVASHSYHLTKALSSLGINISFVDTRLSDEKTVPSGIRYDLIADLSVPSTIKQFLKLPLLSEFWTPILRYCLCLRPRDLVKVFYIVLKLLDVCRERSVDLFHAQHANERALATWLVARKFKKPLVITAHCAEFSEDFFWSRCSQMVKHITKEADRVISVSKYTQRCMAARGCEGHVIVIPNGVDTQFFRPGLDVSELRSKYGLGGRTKVVLYVGDLHHRKGPDVLLRAVPMIDERDFKTIVVGSKGGQEEVLKKLVTDLSIKERVVIVEEVRHEFLPLFYNLADIFVFPTVMKTEGFGIVALEAMACGAPVVASRIGAIPEVVSENETGFLFEPANPRELSEKVNILLRNDQMRSRMGRKGRKLAESEYTWASVARKTASVYHSAIEGHRFRGNR